VKEGACGILAAHRSPAAEFDMTKKIVIGGTVTKDHHGQRRL
jgi:hypothetical protein